MPKDLTAEPLNKVRRADRAVEDEGWIKRMLHQAGMGTLATVYDGQPFINMNLFVYNESSNCIFMHTARYGRTQTNVEADETVCFSIGEMGRFLPADEALEFSVEYSGVVIFGRGRIVGEEAEKARALQLLLDKYAPHLKTGKDYRPATSDEVKRTAVYRIDIDSWSGKRKVAPEEFPGAYLYSDITGN